MNNLNANLQNVSARVSTACSQAGRPVDSVRILAVSKRQTVDKIRAMHAAGQTAFGENYLQEAAEKQDELADLGIEWHFIGPIQSNKTREIAARFQWVQSVDREKVLQRLSRQRPDHLPDLNICLQVNIDEEEQKSGIRPEDVLQLALTATGLPRLRLRGLMAIPRPPGNGHDPVHSFERLRHLFEQLCEHGLKLDTLSLGMSADLEQAIAAGSTMVRVGTDLFGPRDS